MNTIVQKSKLSGRHRPTRPRPAKRSKKATQALTDSIATLYKFYNEPCTTSDTDETVQVYRADCTIEVPKAYAQEHKLLLTPPLCGIPLPISPDERYPVDAEHGMAMETTAKLVQSRQAAHLLETKHQAARQAVGLAHTYPGPYRTKRDRDGTPTDPPSPSSLPNDEDGIPYVAIPSKMSSFIFYSLIC